jgi:hypothetical protein
VTPIGGLILAIGWLLLAYDSVRFIFWSVDLAELKRFHGFIGG